MAYHNTPSSDSDLAIINHNRQMLRGPNLLHELIAKPTDGQNKLLLDFVNAGGQHVKLDYEQFHLFTDSLARDIRSHLLACKAGDAIIPAVIPQCPELYIAWVSVLKAGAAYCPVSLDVPTERLNFIVKDVNAPCILTLSTNRAKVQKTLGARRCLSVSLENLVGSSNSPRDATTQSPALPMVAPDHPAYVMYTSGSTGLPKGVKVSHLSVTQSLLAHDEHIPRFKRFFQFASPTFDVSVFEIFFPFFRGATLVSCERERMLSDLPGTLRLLQADAAELTPTVAGTLLRTRQAAPDLKVLLTIGEMLTTQVISEFGGSTEKPSMLYAMYGPTEAAIHCTLAVRLDATASVRSIGKPLSTVTAFVLKEADSLEIAHVGEPGELAISGQLADGYLNRADQNSASFVELPGYGSIYKTGDRAVCKSDGELEILGRLSAGQVKIRGQRVELGEIEEIASKAQGVDIAVASVIDDVLVLFCAGAKTIDVSDVSTVCKSWLPSYMRPSEVIVLQNGIPRLPSGKVDRKTLEGNFQKSRLFTEEDDSLDNEIERDILEVLRNELKSPLRRTSSLWSSGLDSLRSIKVASQLRRKYPNISVALIAEADNVMDLATVLQSEQSSIEQSEVPVEATTQWKNIEATLYKNPDFQHFLDSWDSILPCSSMQIAMLVETSNRDHLNFNEISLSTAPGIDHNDFLQAFRSIADQNEILRSGFVSTGDQAMPFARVIWHNFQQEELNLLHPLQLSTVSPNRNTVTIRIHHALYDGWSWDLILDDLNSFLSERPLPARKQFSDFYESELRQLAMQKDESLRYWHETLRGYAHTPFPNLSSTKFDQSEKKKTSIISKLSIEMQSLSDSSSSIRCSRQSFLECAWVLLLSSYADTTDVAIGVVSAGRHLPMLGIETIIGPCLATLPLRLDLGTLRTVHDVINHVQRQHWDHLKYGSLALIDIHRSAGLHPGQRLFDTLCVWQEDYDQANRDRSKVSTKNYQDYLDYSIILEFEPRDGQLFMKMTFDSGLLPEAHATLLASQMNALVSLMINNLDKPFSTLWKDCDSSIMSLSNTNYETFNEDFDLVSAISELAHSNPERVAVEYVDFYSPDDSRIAKQYLTYGSLYTQACKIASTLTGKFGVQQDELVCILASKSIELYVGILGVILAGSAYLCVDFRTPAERTRQILRQSKSKIILSDSRDYSNFQPHDEQTVVRISDAIYWGSEFEKGDKPPPADGLAYAVFTSGSTGTPKGVLITRRNLLSNIRDLSRIYPSDPSQDKLLQACSPAFDVSVFEIFWTWCRGMTLCAASNDVLFRDIESLIRELKITHLSLTPSVAALVSPQNVPCVKMLVTAGEPMNSKVFSEWSGNGLYQGYGPSETTNVCNVRPAVSQQDMQSNVGPALPNTSLFVCERQDVASKANEHASSLSLTDFQLLPRGAIGEIWVGGEQVGRGYIDPELTAKSFFQHPVYGRLYRSGDIGRLLVDETLVITGREDDQVKLRGQRLELGEINSSLLRCEGVNDAVSMIIREKNETDRLISFWSSNTHRSLNKEDEVVKTKALFDQLIGILPTYMIPDTLLYVEQIPLTRQGKTDRRAVVEMYHALSREQLQHFSRQSKTSENTELLSDFEREVAEVISATLQVPLDNVKRDSSFFALGLDSISAIRLTQNLKKVTHQQMDVSTILRNPSIIQLLSASGDRSSLQSGMHDMESFDRFLPAQWKANITAQYAQCGLEVESFRPCTPLQESMAMTSAGSETGAYRNVIIFGVHGDLEKLRTAWSLAIVRHQLLRTGLVASELAERPYLQVVLKQFELPWQVKLDQSSTISNLDELMLPPWHIKVIQDREGTKLVLEIHHVLYDAEAMSILLTEIQSGYYAERLPPPIKFDRYLSFMKSQHPTEQDRFWQTQLQQFSPCRMGDILRPQDKKIRRGISAVQHTATMSLENFKDGTRKLSTTSLCVLQTAWSRLLFCVFQRRDVCFGTVLSGRNLPIEGVENIVGPCFNTTPTRVKIKHNQSSSSLCHDLQQINTDVLSFQPSPLRRIQQQNSEDGGPLFDTLLLLQHNEIELDENIWRLESETGDMEFPFILEIILDAKYDCVRLKLHSLSAKDQLLNDILRCYDNLLRDIISFPQARALDYSTIEASIPKFLLPAQRDNTAVARAKRHVEAQSSHLGFSETEQRIMQVIRQLKPGLPSAISKDTTIYRLGLDSINAIQLAATLRKLSYTISSGDILEAMTIQRIAAFCSKNHTNNVSSYTKVNIQHFDIIHRHKLCEEYSIDETNVQDVRPCTPTQSGILSQFLRTNGALYFNTLRLCPHKSIDISKLKSSWYIVMSSHDMLRTRFVELDDPKYPFAMVTYRQDFFELPWSRAQGSSALRTSPNAKSLTTTPWHLSLTEDDSGVVLEVSMLHALYDARSLDIILHDVACVYRGMSIPEPPCINTAIMRILSLGSAERSQEFWSGLGTELCPTKFPDFRIFNTAKSTLKAVSKQFDVNQAEIKAKCAQADSSLQSLFVAAWSRLLAAYTAQDHVTFGVVLSGRDFGSDQDNDVCFPCINTVPFALHVSENLSETLKRATDRSAEILKHQYTPLSTIKRLAGVEGELFDTVVALQVYEGHEDIERPWSKINDEASAEYCLSLEIFPEHNDKFLFQLTCREDIVPVPQAAAILDQFSYAVNEIISAIDGVDTTPNTTVFSAIPPKDERIPTQVQFLHEFVELTTQKHPDRPALEFVTDLQAEVDSRATWSYDQLDRCGNQIAQLLVRQGVRGNELVAICFEKCPEASFSILGVLKAGCGYLAIDPSAPDARKSFILKDSNCSIVLTTHDKVREFSQTPGVSIIAVDKADWQSLSDQKPRLINAINPQDTCYCLYTSGTTGTPKGCLISHSSAVQAMLSFQRIFKGRWNSKSRWLQFASFHFDVSVLEQYWSWSVGICVTSVPRDILFEDLPGTISRLKITHLDLTPSLARLLTPEEVPSLCDGVFIVGGEQVRQEILETWGDSQCLYNFYGPSEVTIGCTVHQNVPKTAKPTNIGRQWDNVGSFVLIPNTQTPVIRGGVGELCLSGPLVGKGYLNRPELTAEKFITLEVYNTRIYRTGDLVRVLHDDSFEFLGRIDDQVKLRGQRLEIGEINHIIMSASPKLKDVATMVLKHPIQQKDQLVTFFCTEEKQNRKHKPTLIDTQVVETLIKEIKSECADRLPSYMVPTYYFAVSVIPLTINNKLDQKGLKTLFEEHLSATSNSASNDELQNSNKELSDLPQVIEVVASFLQISNSTVQPSSRLFELGVDSISAIGLSRAFKKRGYEHVTVATILRYPSVIGLAQAFTRDIHETDITPNIADAQRRIQLFAHAHLSIVTETLAVSPDEIAVIAPCTPLQEGMISKVVGANNDKDTTYFSVFHYDLGVDVDLERLEAIWNATEQETAILRTRFVSTIDGFAQVVLRTNVHTGVQLRRLQNGKTHLSVPWTDYFMDWIKSTRSFAAQLPWKVDLITFGKRKYMSLQIFHGLYDGISLNLLLDKVHNSYFSTKPKLDGETKFFDALPYGPLSSQPNEKGFWTSKLPSIMRLNLSLKDSTLNSRGKVVFLQERVVQTELSGFCNRLDVTVSAFFQAAWLYVLHQVYGVNPTIGVVVSGRALALEGADGIIGPMFNTIPFAVCNLPKKESKFSDLVQACHQFNIELLPFHHTPLRQIARHIGQDVRQGLFEVLFVFQKAHPKNNKASLWQEIPTQQSLPEYPLNLEVEQKGDEFNATLLTKPEYVDQNHAEELLGLYLDLVRGVDKISDLAMDSFCEGTFPSNGLTTPSSLSSSTSIATLVDDSPWSDMELIIRTEVAQLASVPEDSLGKDSPTIFEIGLDSIEAMKLSARLRIRSARIATSAIMKSPTIAGIASHIGALAMNSQQDEHHDATLPNDTRMQQHYRDKLQKQGIDLEHVQSILPVTPMQEGLLLEPGKYFNVLVYKLRRDVDLQRLKVAWESTLQSEAILRTRFAIIDAEEGDDSIVQYVTTSAVELDVLYNESITNIVNNMKAMVTSSAIERHKFHSLIVDNGGTGVFLVLGSPHALYDAWSLHLLHRKVGTTYCSAGNFLPQPKTMSYDKHIQEVIRHNRVSEAKQFWQEGLRAVQPSNVADHITVDESSIGRIRAQASSEVQLVDALRFCRTQGVTLQSLGLTVWTIALAHIIQRLDVCFGLVLSGRTTENSEELIFPTFNTVIFAPSMHENGSNATTLKQVHNTMVRVSEYQHFPLRNALRIARAQQQGTLFDTLFTFQKLPTTDAESPVLYDEYNEEDNDINPPYPVNIEFEGHESGLRWTIAVQEGLLDQKYVDGLMAMLNAVLSSIINCPNEQIVRRKADTVSICGLPFIQMELRTTGKLNPSQNGSRGNTKVPSDTWSPVEVQIRDVLAKVSKTDKRQISKLVGFYHLGLDSVSAIKVASLLRQEGIRLPVSEIVKAQTIEKMALVAGKLDQPVLRAKQSPPPLGDDSMTLSFLQGLGMNPADFEEVFPTTAGQTYMLDMWSASHGHLFYPTFWLDVCGMTTEKIHQAIDRLVQSTPMLRTKFVRTHQGEILSLVVKNETIGNHEFPWSVQIEQREQSHLVTWKLHHSLYDAVSLRLMLSELGKLCQNSDHVVRVNGNLKDFVLKTKSNGDARKEFWINYLTEAREITPSPAKGSFEATRVEIFDPKVMHISHLQAALRRHGITIQALFFAVYAQVYASRLENQIKDVIMGIYLANRSLDIDNLTELSAPTFNLVPLRIRLNSSSIIQIAREVQKDLGEISRLEHCGVSMREIHAWTGNKVDTYVNFLALPENDAGDREEDNGEGKAGGVTSDDAVSVTHIQVDREMKDAAAKMKESSPLFNEDVEKGLASYDWCMVSETSSINSYDVLRSDTNKFRLQPSIDVEAKVSNGYLGIGVFSPQGMLTEDDVKEVIKYIKDVVMSVS
ncbi:hypothetical protein LTR84_009470 [Exophiala bonariae]|uniref:Nonribosomal peptide synthetase sidC n=1 Tax=Exophiala bonariae TaxID=1690606 RepID=A0AAV9MUQ9_9EURO|nr:hypothetical protein LTR84_009470 [Exophiala bonariae]